MSDTDERMSISLETLAYCPKNSAHGKWLNYGVNCPCQPRTRFNLTVNGQYTEAFDAGQIDIMCRLGLIKYESSHHYPNGSMTHYYIPA